MRLTEVEQEAIQKRVDAIHGAPGPWVYGTGKRVLGAGGETIFCADYETPGDLREEVCEFAAHAREDVPALLAEITALRLGLEQLHHYFELGLLERDEKKDTLLHVYMKKLEEMLGEEARGE